MSFAARRRHLRRAHPAAFSLFALAAVFSFPACRQTHSVATVPSEAEANEIIDALFARAIVARKTPAGDKSGANQPRQWQVTVDEGFFDEHMLARSLGVLREQGLPRPNDQGLERAFEGGGMFPSESTQRAQRLKELKTEIERQLRFLPGVVRVSANLVLPEENSLSLNPYPATASVLIVHKSEKLSFDGEYIKQLVAGGVPKLRPEQVGVMLVYEPPARGEVERVTVPPPPAGRSSFARGGAIHASFGGALIALCAVCAAGWLQRRRRGGTRVKSADEAVANAVAQKQNGAQDESAGR